MVRRTNCHFFIYEMDSKLTKDNQLTLRVIRKNRRQICVAQALFFFLVLYPVGLPHQLFADEALKRGQKMFQLVFFCGFLTVILNKLRQMHIFTRHPHTAK